MRWTALFALISALLLQPGAPASAAPPAGDAAPMAAPLPAPIAAALQASDLSAAAVSIRISAPDGRVRLDYQGDAVREVGSLVKLLTTLAALDTLGPAFRFHTDLLADPLPEPVHPGKPPRWQLSLRGGGDPGLRYEDLLHLLRAARAAGVEAVAPEVQVDSSRFSPDSGATSGIRLDGQRVDATPPWPLLVAQAAVQLSLPADRQASPLVDPPFRLRVATHAPEGAGDARCPADWPAQLQLQAVGASEARRHGPGLQLLGAWPSACPEAMLLRAPLLPPDYLDLALATAGRSLGFPAGLHGRSAAAPSLARVMLRQDSRPLGERVHDINKFSNNVMARTLFLDLAAEAGELPATPAAAARVLQAWLARAGLQFPELLLENGAGLSHREVLTARHLELLLKYALTSKSFPEFLDSLPAAGQDGTLRSRFQGVPDVARLRLKSGSLDGVRGLAGYLLGADGRIGTVVCLINDPHAGSALAVQTAVVEWALRDDSATGAGSGPP